MQYYSTNGNAPAVSFREAVFKGLPEDNGLYMPKNIPELKSDFFQEMQQMSLANIGFAVMQPFIGNDIPEEELKNILTETLNFEIPLVKISDNIYSLELFHGPTYAFKDVGARFLARSLSYFCGRNDQKLTVLVATSGDTGSAVAQGFYEVPNIDVIILYPSGGISKFQEQQMTTLGKNITALEVEGVFDDCQRLVKKAFLDNELNDKLNLTSANSINIARMLPQSIYYFYGLAQLDPAKLQQVVVSVPSGNYGNLTAGLIARKMGLPIKHYIACSNANDTVPKYLKTGQYVAKASVSTVSNAMDVGDPSNFVRMLDLFSHSHDQMKSSITGLAYSDIKTKSAINSCYKKTNYILDPHGAIAYLGLHNYLEKNEGVGIFLETAHPYKFRQTVEPQISSKLDPVEIFDDKEKKSVPFQYDFDQFKAFLLNRR
jgi:threonine synthase